MKPKSKVDGNSKPRKNSPIPKTSPGDVEPRLVVHGDIYEVIDYLAEHAIHGNQQYVAHLYCVARASITSLNKVHTFTPKLVHSLASITNMWPVMHGLLPIYQDINLRYLREIGLSKDSSAFGHAKTFQRLTLSKTISCFALYWVSFIKMSGQLQSERAIPATTYKTIRKLPPFSGESWQIWYEAFKVLLGEVTKEHPERTQLLRRFGIAKRSYDKRYQPGSKTSEANIRAEIFAKLKKAFRSLAKDDLVCREVNRPARIKELKEMFRIFEDGIQLQIDAKYIEHYLENKDKLPPELIGII